MKFIDKNKEKSSQQAAIILHDWRDNHVFKYESGRTFIKKKQSLSDTDFASWLEKNKTIFAKIEGKKFIDFCEDLDTETAWNFIHDFGDTLKQQLREALSSEQGHICCYCCQDIKKAITKIEHFLARAKGTCQNTYNYQNLLLSCDGNEGDSEKERIQNVKNGQTWESIVESIKTRFTKLGDLKIEVDDLKQMNPLGPQGGKVIFKLSPSHCDKYKDKSSEDIINPTHLPDCWDRFIYNNNGFIKGEDEVAIRTITVLNLNAKTLVEKRANVWAGLEEMFKEDPEISNYYLENDIAGLKTFIESKLDNEVKSNRPSHFCNVYRAFLKHESAKILKR